MPKFVVERNWIECIGPLWMPATTAAKRIDDCMFPPEDDE